VKKRKSCQKSGRLRTGSREEEEKQSEVRATSDRFEGSRGKAVRSQSNFGQVRGKKRKSSQKQEQLGTGSAEEEEKLSELTV
jgi:hypothetical protein